MSPEAPWLPLDAARLAGGLSVEQLWVRYIGNGGSATAAEFRSFLQQGRPWSGPLQYDITVSALNDRFTELDMNRRVPYWTARSRSVRSPGSR